MDKYAVRTEMTYRDGTVVGDTKFVSANTHSEAVATGEQIARSTEERSGIKTDCTGAKNLSDIPW